MQRFTKNTYTSPQNKHSNKGQKKRSNKPHVGERLAVLPSDTVELVLNPARRTSGRATGLARSGGGRVVVRDERARLRADDVGVCGRQGISESSSNAGREMVRTVGDGDERHTPRSTSKVVAQRAVRKS